MKVLFDTNSLLIPLMFKLNPYQGVKELVPKAELITLQACVDELKGLKPVKWDEILQLALDNGLRIIDYSIKGLSVDDTIVEFAKQKKCLVLTQDKALRKKLLNNSLRVVLLRQKKRFVLTG